MPKNALFALSSIVLYTYNKEAKMSDDEEYEYEYGSDAEYEG